MKQRLIFTKLNIDNLNSIFCSKIEAKIVDAEISYLNICVLQKLENLDFVDNSCNLNLKLSIIIDYVAMKCNDDKGSLKDNFSHKSDY